MADLAAYGAKRFELAAIKAKPFGRTEFREHLRELSPFCLERELKRSPEIPERRSRTDVMKRLWVDAHRTPASDLSYEVPIDLAISKYLDSSSCQQGHAGVIAKRF